MKIINQLIKNNWLEKNINLISSLFIYTNTIFSLFRTNNNGRGINLPRPLLLYYFILKIIIFLSNLMGNIYF